MSSDELTSEDVRTIGGQEVAVVVDGGTITFGGAAVEEADILASNGIAHAIDALPEVAAAD